MKSQLQKMSGFWTDYIWNAGANDTYDIKWSTPAPQERGREYYGSQITPGVYASGRDGGNILAGMAFTEYDVAYENAMSGLGALQQASNSKFWGGVLYGLNMVKRYGRSAGPLDGMQYYGENPISGSIIHYGWAHYEGLMRSFGLYIR